MDKHRGELVMRVSKVDPILDELLAKKVLTVEDYEIIVAQPTAVQKMRFICNYVHKRGRFAKDVFLSVLQKLEPILIADLRGQSGCGIFDS